LALLDTGSTLHGSGFFRVRQHLRTPRRSSQIVNLNANERWLAVQIDRDPMTARRFASERDCCLPQSITLIESFCRSRVSVAGQSDCSQPNRDTGMMPKRFNRYLILELTKVFLVTLTFMTLLMVMVGVVQESIREGLTPITIVKLIPYTLPNALCFAIPGTILFSVCNVLGRMSANNEIVALKSLGISPMTVLWPIFVVAFILSLMTVVLNDFAVSWGRQGIYRVVLHSVQNTIYAKLNAEKSYRRNDVAISVQDVDGLDLYGLVVEVHASGSEQPFYLTAKRARLEVNIEKNTLVITTEEGLVQGDSLKVQIDQDEIELPLEDVSRKKDKSLSPSNLPLRLISYELEKQEKDVHSQRQQLAVNAAMQSLGGDVLAMSDKNWTYAREKLDASEYRKHRLYAEPWRRWANGFSCLCFVLVGAPLAIHLQKADFWTIFAACFLPILIVYYPLLMLGVGYAKTGEMPPYSVWLGNVALLVAGGYLIQKIKRH